MATTYTVTKSFSSGTTAVASEVNQNFTDILTALNSFDITNTTGTLALARISSLTSSQMSSAFFKDEDDMTSNSATAVASQQSVKAFVNTNRSGWTPSIAVGYAGGESVTFPNGFIIKTGWKEDAATTTTVTFGTPFPNAIVSATVTGKETSSNSYVFIDDTEGISVDDIVVRRTNSLAGGFYWTAMGY